MANEKLLDELHDLRNELMGLKIGISLGEDRLVQDMYERMIQTVNRMWQTCLVCPQDMQQCVRENKEIRLCSDDEKIVYSKVLGGRALQVLCHIEAQIQALTYHLPCLQSQRGEYHHDGDNDSQRSTCI